MRRTGRGRITNTHFSPQAMEIGTCKRFENRENREVEGRSAHQYAAKAIAIVDSYALIHCTVLAVNIKHSGTHIYGSARFTGRDVDDQPNSRR